MAQPATLDNARPVAADAGPKLLVKGFNDNSMERRLLDGTVKLSQRRLPRLDLLSDADGERADAVLIDTRDPQAMKWAANQAWLMYKAVIWVDAQTARHGHTVVRRPVQWPNLPMLLARALEQGPTGQAGLFELPTDDTAGSRFVAALSPQMGLLEQLPPGRFLLTSFPSLADVLMCWDDVKVLIDAEILPRALPPTMLGAAAPLTEYVEFGDEVAFCCSAERLLAQAFPARS